MSIKAEQCKYGNVGWPSDLELFAKVATNPKQWLGTAKQHIYAAQVLLPYIRQRHKIIKEMLRTNKSFRINTSLDPTYFLMCALASENILKSVIVFRFEEEIRLEIQTKYRIHKKLLGHNLVDLANRAGYEIDLDQEYVLRFLTRYVTWAGKYPLPISNNKNDVTEKLSDGDFYAVGGYNPENVPYFLSFCNELYHWAENTINKENTKNKHP